MSSQLFVSPRISRQNTTLWINLGDVTISTPFRFISVSALPPLIHVGSVVCTVNGQSLASSSVTASRPHHDHLVLQFAEAVTPSSPSIACAVEVQFAGGSSATVVSVTTDTQRPTRGLSNSTVDASFAVVPFVSVMSASVAIRLPVAGQQTTTLLFSLTGTLAAAPIRFIAIASLPLFSTPASAMCTTNGAVLAPVPSVPQPGTLLLQLAAAIALNSSGVECTLSVLFDASGNFY